MLIIIIIAHFQHFYVFCCSSDSSVLKNTTVDIDEAGFTISPVLGFRRV